MAVCTFGFILLLLQSPGAPASHSISPAELLDAYASGQQIDRTLRRIGDLTTFGRELVAAADSWVPAAPLEAGRRRLILASAALEAAASDLRGRDAQQTLILWGAGLLAQQARSEGERVWYRAAAALLQRTYHPMGPEFFETAATRFPQDDRLLLARALVEEQRSWRVVSLARRLRGRDAARDVLSTVAAGFERLVVRPAIRAEVQLRLGLTYLRLERPSDALKRLAEVESLTDDPFLRYLARCFTGRARQASRDAAGAAAAFQSALDLFPRAQSASFPLAALALRADDRFQAQTLVDTSIAGAERAVDPWRTYQEADYRFWPELVAELRKLLR